MTDEPEDMRSEALKRLLAHLSENLRGVTADNDEREERESFLNQAEELAKSQGGIVVPMPVDLGDLNREYAKVLRDLTDEQARASLFFGVLDNDHPYKKMFSTLGEVWANAALIGAMKIAQHYEQTHQGSGDVGPKEFNAAWVSISVTAVLGAIRYGQSHPDALKGMEGIKEGELDETVAKLIAWAEEEHQKLREQNDEPEDPKES